MSIIVLQKPYDLQPAQSPIVFSVKESTQAYTSSEFQYTANLYVWSGNQSQSGSYIYSARKYPNQSGSGIFDFSRMINSTLTELVATNGSNVKYYKVDFGWQYASGSSYVSQPGGLTQVTASENGYLFKAYDGYSTYVQPDANSQRYNNNSYTIPFTNGFVNMPAGYINTLSFPFLTNCSTVTQSVVLTDKSRLQSSITPTGRRGISISTEPDNNYLPGNYRINLTASYEDGSKLYATQSFIVSASASANTSQSVLHYPCAPGDIDWPIIWNLTTSSLASYQFNITTNVGTLLTVSPINYKVICPEQYYTPVRIAYKNMYGQLDWFNFYKRSNYEFSTDQRVYQPQIGTWEASSLTTDTFQAKTQRYIVDANQTLTVNTDWLDENYNQLFKELLVSDEIYYLKNNNTSTVYPLTIKTNDIAWKTGVNNKLIQYTITFDLGQPYKFIF